jgi:hypothetical protein
MRTKTLLIAAAALAATVITSEAQVYSANVVGYVNQIIPAHSYQIYGSQLINGSDANATNGDINTTFLTGFGSDPNGPAGALNNGGGTNSVLYQWTGSGYNNFYYFTAADATTWEANPPTTYPAGWYDAISGNPANVNLNSGLATFIFNASGIPMTNTFVGVVAQGTNSTTIHTGFNLIALQEPISTNPLVSGFGLPPLNSDPNGPAGALNNGGGTNDVYYQWSGSGYNNYYYFSAADATIWEANPPTTYPAGFYDAISGNPMPTSSYPQVNQGFFLYHFGSPITWTNSFTIQ